MRTVPRSVWLGATAVAMTVPTAWAISRLVSGTGDPRIGVFRGARLGMTTSDLRRSFDEPGRWRTEAVAEGDLRLVWEPEAPSEGASSAIFELHDGLLVAIRADLDSSAPEAAGPALETSDAAVRARGSIAGGRVRLRVIARNCPTHAGEVADLLGGS